MTEYVHYRVEQRLAILTIDNPPVNALSASVQEQLRACVTRAVNDDDVDAAVIIGAGTTFVAGADIRQLERMAREGVVRSLLPQVLAEIEAAPKPFVAAIQGNAYGGGLEVALASHYRIASADARIGQPEVTLGLIPGAGGTQRLPRLAGVEAALEMCVFGEPVRADAAVRLGALDRIADGDLLSGAIQFAREVSTQGPRPTRDRDDRLGTRESNAALFNAYRERVRKTRRNLLAPAAAIDAIEAATAFPFAEGCRRERDTFERLLVSSQAKALIHLFLAERAANKVPGVQQEHVIPIRSAAVVGAGTMGRGIAMCFANVGIPVRLREPAPEALEAAVKSIQGIYEGSVRKGRIAESEMRQRLSMIQPQLDYTGFDAADVVIEAAFENIDVKRSVFAELGARTKVGAILATNTSYLDIDEMARASSRPDAVVGLHFFSPANVMRLVEVVPGRATSTGVTAAALALAKQLGKLAVVAGNCPGFIGNRMLRAYRREAQLLLEEGASPSQVDSALEKWGMAMGPFAAQDLAGIDIAMSSRVVFAPLDRPGGHTPRAIDMLYALGRFGRKTGAGWYLYEEGRQQDDPDVAALIERAARESGTFRRSITSEEILTRTVYALINEGAQILEEGYALRASDIDLVYVNGYGFPAYRGGPMHVADEVGLSVVRERILEIRATHGADWEPSPLVERLADSSGSFGEWDGSRSSRLAASEKAHSDEA